VAPKTLEVHLNDGGTRVLAGDQVFLNIGTYAAIPNVPGLDAARPLTSIEALELDYVPHPAYRVVAYSGKSHAQKLFLLTVLKRQCRGSWTSCASGS
jgi:hypothetical protein